jgi:hypothetical protein
MTQKPFTRDLEVISEDIARVAVKAKALADELGANEIYGRMLREPQNFGSGEQALIKSYRAVDMALRRFHAMVVVA